jgi:hypothetical protein
MIDRALCLLLGALFGVMVSAWLCWRAHRRAERRWRDVPGPSE